MPNFKALARLFMYDPASGIARWNSRERSDFTSQRAFNAWNKRYAFEVAGYVNNSGRIAVKIFGKAYLLHRIIWAMVNEIDLCDVPDEIDHKDMNPLNNKISNLRPATRSQNNHNRTAYKTNTSGFKGVSFHKATSKWVAQIGINGSRKHLGLFESAEDAFEARKIAQCMHGEYARLYSDSNS